MTNRVQDRGQEESRVGMIDSIPDESDEPKKSSPRRALILQTLAWTACFALIYAGFAWWRTGSISDVLPYLQGQRLLVHPLKLELGDQPLDTVIDKSVTVVNATGSDVTFLGAQKSCTCVALDDFPLTVPPGETCQLKLSLAMPRKPGSFEQSVKYFTDYDNPSVFSVTVTATVR